MYLEFYGLKERPFEPVPDPKYFFTSSKHKTALSYLEYGFLTHLGFIVITGEPGTGKTLLIKKFLTLFRKVAVATITNTNLDPLEFLQAVLQKFNISYNKNETKAHLLDKLQKFLTHKYTEKQPVILIIDEAQNLPFEVLEEIRMLSNLQTEKENLLQIILVGQPALRNKLHHPSLKQLLQRVSLNYHLLPLEKTETEAYIKHRLKVAGARNADIFLPEAIEAIFKHTRGIPRLINTICDAALVYGFADELKIITENVINDVVKEMYSYPASGQEQEEEEQSQILLSDKSEKFLSELDLRLRNLEKNVYELCQKTITLMDRLASILEKMKSE